MSVSVWDIADAEGFVRDIVQRKFHRMHRDERDELVAEGLVVLFDLARRYDPSKDTGSKDPLHICGGPRCCVASFAGYASFLLPAKMNRVWHNLHPEHVSVTLEDGTRGYVYLQPATYLEHEGDSHFMDDRSAEYRVAHYDDPRSRHVGDFIPVPVAA